MKRIFSIIIAISLILSCFCGGFINASAETANETQYIDNSDLLPEYKDDDEVELEDSGDGLYSPDWVKTLIICEWNVRNATSEGTFDAAISLLDHYAETGVNGIWLTPIYDDNDDSNYGNYGVHTISKAMTGCDNYEDGFAKFKNFVDEAHSRNIRIFLDVVTWGCDTEAPLYNEHPEWFKGYSYWGGWDYDFSNEEFYEYFVTNLVKWTTDYGVDGFRCDCEPSYTGYTMFKDVRERALAAGEKICIFSENTNERMNGCYDFDEHSAGNDQWNIWELFTEKYDLIDAVKNGTGLSTNYYQLTGEAGKARFYSYNMSCHDQDYGMDGNMAITAYQAMFTPFIPIFMMGEEFDNDSDYITTFSTPLNLDLLNEERHRQYFEEFKLMIRLRRTYADIFEEFPTHLYDTKIEEVEVVGLETIQGYVRYNDKYAFIVVANNNIHTSGPFTVRVPFAEIGYEDAEYSVTDLITGEIVATGNYKTLYDFQADVAQDKAGLYLLQKIGSLDGEKHEYVSYSELVVDKNGKAVTESVSDTAVVETVSTDSVTNVDSEEEDVSLDDSDNSPETGEAVTLYTIISALLAFAFAVGVFSYTKKMKFGRRS